MNVGTKGFCLPFGVASLRRNKVDRRSRKSASGEVLL